MTYKEAARELEMSSLYLPTEKNTKALEIAVEVLKKADADGCAGCEFEDVEEWEMPCAKCKRNSKDYWRARHVDDFEVTG